MNQLKKPKAIIWDVDGVLRCFMHREHMKPSFETNRFVDWLAHSKNVHKDKPIWSNIDKLNLYAAEGFVNILLTSACCDSEITGKTLLWMDSHGVNYDRFIGRAEGDDDTPAVSKRFYLELLMDYYDIYLFVDDSLVNIQMAKDMGLDTLHYKYR